MNMFNKKTILFFSITTLMINGCVAKNEFEPKNKQVKVMNAKPYVTNKIVNKPAWGKMASVKAKKDDCIDCFAVPIDYSKPPSATNNAFKKPLNKSQANAFPKFTSNTKAKELKRYGNYPYQETASDTAVKTAMKTRNFNEQNVVSAPIVQNSSYGSLSPSYHTANTSIQVGAFRKYSGAKKYVKRYKALANQYKVTMRKGTKDNQTIYRVRIEGFKNKSEAKNFMSINRISDGFLVRK